MTRIAIRRGDGSSSFRGHDDSRDGRENEAVEYRQVVADALGRELPPGAVVHHRNRKRHENGIQNLLLMHNQALHMLLHAYIKSGRERLQLELERFCAEWVLSLVPKAARQRHPYAQMLAEIDAALSSLDPDRRTSSSKLAEARGYLGQYYSAKWEYPNHLVFIQLGVFLELYEEDAREMSRRLGWRISARPFPMNLVMTGVPADSTKVFEYLESIGRSYVVMLQSPMREGHILRRDIVRVFNGGPP